MTPAPDHPVIKEWIFARDILRRTGFQPEDLFFLAQPHPHERADTDPGAEIFLVLKTQGKQFNWGIGVIETATTKELEAFYDAVLVPAWQTSSALWKDSEFFASNAFKDKIDVLEHLIARGLHIPGRVN